jgi:antitoxin component YwqK of YwqJK toxin-antitoxin module
MRSFIFFGAVLFSFCLLSGCKSKSEQKLVGVNPEQVSVDSLFNGEKSVFYEDGKLHYIVEYKKGKANGRVREFYPDGKIYMDAIFKDGHRDGKCTHFFKNGKPFSVTNYVNGEKDGIETKYYEDGKVLAINTYKKDKVQPGLKEFNRDGTEVKENVSILITEMDHTASEGIFILQVSLSDIGLNANFYASPSGGSRVKLRKSGNSGILEVPVTSRSSVIKQITIEAEYKNHKGNTVRLQKLYNLDVHK